MRENAVARAQTHVRMHTDGRSRTTPLRDVPSGSCYLAPCFSPAPAPLAIFGPLRFSLHEPSVAGNTVMPYGMWVLVAVSSSVASSLEVREPIKGPEKKFVCSPYLYDGPPELSTEVALNVQNCGSLSRRHFC